MTRGRASLGGVLVGDGHPVAIAGAINVSPESFYAGSVRTRADDLVRAAMAMVEAGAALIDVGARSTAPYGQGEVPEEEERARIARAVEPLARVLPVPLSVDTTRAAVARAALDAGATVVNDVSGLRDPAMGPLARRAQGVILMASPPADGPAAPGTTDPAGAVAALLAAALERARAAGIADDRIVLDPGLGFFRNEAVPWPEWDVRVLAGLAALRDLGRPLCVGVSRKSFLGALTGRRDPAQRLPGSLAATALAVAAGAALVRTHDVPETVDAVRVAERVRAAARP